MKKASSGLKVPETCNERCKLCLFCTTNRRVPHPWCLSYTQNLKAQSRERAPNKQPALSKSWCHLPDSTLKLTSLPSDSHLQTYTTAQTQNKPSLTNKRPSLLKAFKLFKLSLQSLLSVDCTNYKTGWDWYHFLDISCTNI